MVLGVKLEETERKAVRQRAIQAQREGRNFQVLENLSWSRRTGDQGPVFWCLGFLAHWIGQTQSEEILGPDPEGSTNPDPPLAVPRSHKSVDCPSNQSWFAENQMLTHQLYQKTPTGRKTNPGVSSRWHVEVLMNCRGSVCDRMGRLRMTFRDLSDEAPPQGRVVMELLLLHYSSPSLNATAHHMAALRPHEILIRKKKKKKK